MNRCAAWGRIYKDRGDLLHDGHFTHESMIRNALPSYQNYQAALKFYRQAYELSHDYYPGINVATLALMVGDSQLMEKVANEVLQSCSRMALDRHDQAWILASEGEASLLLGQIDRAVHFYRTLLQRVLSTERGLLQSIYDQLCRLYWVLGPTAVGPVVELFEQYIQSKQLRDLETGPFTNCGRGK